MKFLAVLFSLAMFGQPAFEVASVKVVDPKASSPVLPTCANNRFTSTMVLPLVLVYAFDLPGHSQLELEKALPAWPWTRTTIYNIEAKSSEVVSAAQCKAMVQALLADRFNLRFHWAERPGDAYVLTIAPGGHKLHPVAPGKIGNVTILRDGYPISLPESQKGGMTSSEIAGRFLGFLHGAPVSDETKLEGSFSFSLRFSMRLNTTAEYSDPDLVSAVRQQLGLRLELKRSNLTYFELDHIERASEN